MDELTFEESVEEISKLDAKLFLHYSDVPAHYLVDRNLGMMEPQWYTTMLELDDEEREDLVSLLLELRPSILGESITIIAVPEDIGYNFVYPNVTNDIDTKGMPYMVPNRFILASVSPYTKEIFINDLSEVRLEPWAR